MAKSRIFEQSLRGKVERKIGEGLNSRSIRLSVIDNPFLISNLLRKNLNKIFSDTRLDYTPDLEQHLMADLAFFDNDGFYYVVDVKTHRLDTHFNMPNLTSVERLARFYEDDKNYFVVLVIAYKLEGARVVVEKVHFVPIEFLSWTCLTIGALGWGQIQIANSNKIDILVNSRKTWMLELCSRLFDFYPAEIGKIKKRINRFKKVHINWLAKKD